MTECAVASCTRPRYGRGDYCTGHYQRVRQYGHPDAERPFRRHAGDPDYLWYRVKVTDRGCWQWQGSVAADGYGRVRWNGNRGERAHRAAYMSVKGPIPEGLHLDHLCRNRACVNPDHLEAVTPGENWRRGMSRAAVAVRTNRCQRGHEFTPENTGWVGKNHASRVCLACRSAGQKRRRHRYP